MSHLTFYFPLPVRNLTSLETDLDEGHLWVSLVHVNSFMQRYSSW
jgi:hypothetical protein